MKTIATICLLVWVLFIGGAGFFLRIRHMDYTETRLFFEYWVLWVIAIAGILILSAIAFWGEK